MIKISKNDTYFSVTGDYSINWFLNNINNGNWEEETFKIFDLYKNPNKIYLDIGAWIGPTVLYNAQKFKNIYCFEPDPVAYENLKNNITINNYNNINIINKALSDIDGNVTFGGNGDLGNSMSTLLVGLDNKEDFFNNYGSQTQFLSKEIRMQNIISVNSITIDTFINNYNIDPSNIGLIKIDIEGGEIIVIPAIADFLRTYKPPLYISFHFVFLKSYQVHELYKILFNIYTNVFYYEKDRKKKVTLDDTLINNYYSLVFDS